MKLQRWLTRRVFVACAGMGVVAAVACGTSPSTDPAGMACDALVDSSNAVAVRCGGRSIPAEYKSRFRTYCVAWLGYPGQGITPQSLSDCAAVYGASDCHGSQGAQCWKSGSLADGSACNATSQCKSGWCEIPSTADHCGTCVPTVPNGQSCATPGTRCMQASSCTKGICVGYNTVDAGGDCSNSADVCKRGLGCEAQKCIALEGLGSACTSTASCQDGLVCSAKVCAKPLALQADCSQAMDGCAVGNECDVTTKKCVSTSFVKPGQPCGFLTTGMAVCFIGQCQLDSQKTTGTCPAVIPDGQRCGSSDHCDYGSRCTNNLVCVLSDTVCN